jgi:hypothetical protein
MCVCVHRERGGGRGREFYISSKVEVGLKEGRKEGRKEDGADDSGE